MASRQPQAFGELWKGFLRGGYPELANQPDRDASLWHASYIQTYLERDMRMLRQIGDLTQYQNFLCTLAARSAQLLSLTDVSRDLGVAVNTVKAWLSVLEATYQVTVLRPYFANVGKRLVKTPKVYFNDVGTLCYLAGLQDPVHAASGPMGGAIMETAVLSEIIRTLTHRGADTKVYFWRTAAGTEVDFVIETSSGLVPIEVKLSATPQPAMATAIKIFKGDIGKQCDARIRRASWRHAVAARRWGDRTAFLLPLAFGSQRHHPRISMAGNVGNIDALLPVIRSAEAWKDRVNA